MSQSADFRSGKGHRDENFPVASRLVSAKHRPVIMAFYDFARAADDIADHTTLPADEKLMQLDRLEGALLGQRDDDTIGVALCKVLAARQMSPRHALDLLKAFRLDVTKTRYENWDELIDYCSYSAKPVGRFVLDVHGESVSTWPASDALCVALQIINHLQDCGKDYRDLDRVYIPLDALAAAGAQVADLGRPSSSSPLLGCLQGLARRTTRYLGDRPSPAARVRDTRLACEVAVIESIAHRLLGILETRDPLGEQVHLRRGEVLRAALAGGFAGLVSRLRPRDVSLRRSQDAKT